MEKTGKSPSIVWNEVLATEKVFRFTCLDAFTRKEGCFEVQAVARVVDKERGEYPVFRFMDNPNNVYLFGYDRSTPVKPDRGAFALGGYSGSFFPTDFGPTLKEGIVIGQDYSFLNYNGTANHLYAAKVTKLEQMIGSQKAEINQKEVGQFALRVHLADIARNETRERRLRGELRVETSHGKFHLGAACEDGTRLITQEGGNGMAVGKLIEARVGDPMVFSVKKGDAERRVMTRPVIQIVPDPDQD